MNRSIRLDSLGTISDNSLVRQLESLRGKERRVLAAVLRHLIEMERRRLYLPRGYSSLFEFCTQHLKYSRSAAGRRIASARTLVKFPSLERYLLDGEINLYCLSLVSGILTEENYDRIIPGIRNRSTGEVEALAAAYRPGKVLKDRVKTVCVMVPETVSSSRNRRGSADAPVRATPGTGSEQPPDTAAQRPRDDSLERVRISRKYKFEFAATSEFKKKFDRMKALLSGRYPEGLSFETLFMLLMDEYIERHSPEGRSARRKKRQASMTGGDSGSTRTDKTARGNPVHDSSSSQNREKDRTRSIPRKIRDEVFLRDGGRCTFTGTDGRRCNSKWGLQIDHIVPFARGGDDSPGNLRLLCGKHNRLEAERAFGSQHMKRFKKEE